MRQYLYNYNHNDTDDSDNDGDDDGNDDDDDGSNSNNDNDNNNDDNDNNSNDTTDIVWQTVSNTCFKRPGCSCVPIACNTMGAGHLQLVVSYVVCRDSSAVKLDRAEITFISSSH